MRMAFWNKKTEETHSHGPAELVGVDFASTGLKVVRVRKHNEEIVVNGVALLPAPPPPGKRDKNTTLSLPKALTTNYAALACSGKNAVVRLLSIAGHADTSEAIEEHIREHVGITEGHRVGYSLTNPSRGKTDTKVLVVSLPEEEAEGMLSLVATGAPAPRSLEISGLAAMHVFTRGPGRQHAQEAVGLIEAGAQVTVLSLFNKGILSLVRKFEFGSDALLNKVQQQLNVSAEIAQGIMSDGSFDISQSVHETMDPFLRQASISKDFIERREECHLGTIYLSGGLSLLRYWGEAIQTATGVETRAWNPFDGMTMAADAFPADLDGQQTRFTAALGACLGEFDAT